MKFIFAILLSFLFILMSPIAALADTVYAYDAADSGKSFDIAANALVTVSLETNPSTGYHWDNVPVNPASGISIVVAKFDLLNENFVPVNPGLPGTNGVDVFSYKVESLGIGGLKLEKVSPSGQTVETVEIGFTVTNQ